MNIMEFWLILLIILLILIAIVIVRVVYEVTHPQYGRYSVETQKLGANEKIRIVFLADLHSKKYGKNNIKLIRLVSNAKPDFIILGGDMITASHLINQDERTLDALSGLSNIAPVYYAPGNHEKALSENPRKAERFDDFMFELESMDIPYLADQNAILTEDMYVYGLDIDSLFYKKTGKKRAPSVKYIEKKLGLPDKRKFNILVSHTPAFFNTYVKTDFDLILCGHYHGGLVNLPWLGPVFSPEFDFRPKHCAGAFRKNGKVVIVTRGIGTHLFNIRLFNRPEVTVIDIKNRDSLGGEA